METQLSRIFINMNIWNASKLNGNPANIGVHFGLKTRQSVLELPFRLCWCLELLQVSPPPPASVCPATAWPLSSPCLPACLWAFASISDGTLIRPQGYTMKLKRAAMATREPCTALRGHSPGHHRHRPSWLGSAFKIRDPTATPCCPAVPNILMQDQWLMSEWKLRDKLCVGRCSGGTEGFFELVRQQKWQWFCGILPLGALVSLLGWTQTPL